MDRDIERLVEATGASLPLAGRIIGLILDSGADQLEAFTALELATKLLGRTSITLDRQVQAELDAQSS
jgi:hypothetical protein